MNIENLLNSLSVKLNLRVDNEDSINSENEFLPALMGIIDKGSQDNYDVEGIYNVLNSLVTVKEVKIQQSNPNIFFDIANEFNNECVRFDMKEQTEDKNKGINTSVLLLHIIVGNYQKTMINHVNFSDKQDENAVTKKNIGKQLIIFDNKSENYNNSKVNNIAQIKYEGEENFVNTEVDLSIKENDKNIKVEKLLEQSNTEHTDNSEIFYKKIKELKTNQTPIEHVNNTIFNNMSFQQKKSINDEDSKKTLFILIEKEIDDGKNNVNRSKDYINVLAEHNLISSINNEMNAKSKITFNDTTYTKESLSKVFEISKFDDKIYIKKETQDSLSMFIENKEIGKVKISLSINDGVIKAEVYPNTEQAKTYFKENMDKIYTALNNEGINLGQFALKDNRDERKFSKKNGEEVEVTKIHLKQDLHGLSVRKAMNNISDVLSIYV